MSSVVKAGTVYFALVFVVGFGLGTLRVLVVAPRVGVAWAVVLELPVILTVSWILCSWIVRRFDVPARVRPRLAMGLVALALLIAAEAGLAAVFGRGPGEYFASLTTVDGALGFAGQLAFALIPWIRLRL